MENIIDFISFNEADCKELGAEISKFLPPSYPKTAEEVKIYKRRDGEPGADMTFVSKTTGSNRLIRLYQTGVSIYVNGCPIGKNDEAKDNIEKVWKKFKSTKIRQSEEKLLWYLYKFYLFVFLTYC